MKKSKAFTLIELIAVLVILAILALIVTPLVLNIIKKARVSADKRSIDAYGRSIELAIADYLLDTGTFPTSIEDLTIEYTGDKVECETTTLKEDGSVYLAGCTVNEREVSGYTYGKIEEEAAPTYTAYSVGDKVSYNNITYYVIEDSAANNDTVKLLKENPLTVKEINDLNIEGITVTGEDNSYGQVQYGSSIEYATSIVKKVVDAWASVIVNDGDTVAARLITFEEVHNLGYDDSPSSPCGSSCGVMAYSKTESTPSWVYGNYSYWTIGQNGDSTNAWLVNNGGDITSISPTVNLAIRPVVELNKSADITKIN